jgi:3-(3-hydroxy-phenyl)propionate hydroxylase
VVKGTSPDSLLDTYHAERHPVAARVLKTTMAQVALHAGRSHAGRARIVGELSRWTSRADACQTMSGLDIRTMGRGIRCWAVGCPISTSDRARPRRMFSLLHDARPVLLDLAAPSGIDIARGRTAFSTSRRRTPARGSPVLGESRACRELIRPDGHVAWVGDGTARGLTKR